MSEDQTVTIEVDGREIQAKAGQMLIDATDAAGINIPRFCYHKKLSVSANCRMCLVEVAKVPKPLPACATPVAEGMKVQTRSPLAIAAQKGTMEFLLINHPLDCPVCDQGGECELQDVALGYGDDVSRFVEGKRVVMDKEIGPLISTDLTRCIHCTRCVRFGAEIAGVRELGATGRGEHMTIGTYIEKSVDSELSGNMIDVCPVGSLTSKPFRFRARAWELIQRDAIAPHDAVGSNLHLHVRRNEVMRVHPKENDAVNECWISDRDRFSYTALNSAERLDTPLVKTRGEWKESGWHEALTRVASGLKEAGSDLGVLASPGCTVEELHLARKLANGLGSERIETRLRQGDFRTAAGAWLGQSVTDLERCSAALLIGSNVRKEQPIFGHRLRKAALEGCDVSFINPLELEMNYAARQIVTPPAAMAGEVAAVARAAGAAGPLIDQAEVTERHQAIAERLKAAPAATLLLGNLAQAHPDYAVLLTLASALAKATGAVLGQLPAGANSVGAQLVGAVGDGLDAMLAQPAKGYLLMGVEPGYDLWDPAAANAALTQSGFVVALSGFRSESLEAVADVILPVSAFAETSGTFVNAEGTWQSFAGAVSPKGETRPAWKVLRVLGNLLDLQGFDHDSSEEVLAEARQQAEGRQLDNAPADAVTECRLVDAALTRIGDVPIYAVDALVRHAAPLQKTRDAIAAAIYINESEAAKAGLTAGMQAAVTQNGTRVILPVTIDPNIPNGCVRIPAGVAGTEQLGGQFGEVTLEKA
ncbi:MAG: NADH-quinone oxidoreductase subunit G [Candidatus Sedimenticola endophacoides]|uniref:NADH-quinone oxidoreductase n=2 Tax=Candidatus Sedimenticola endophacoides TaxID=2548426 RepID=A0A6N4DST4_9GAMM|nr:MAG: NADH-quinone oxidoreductase subunit G [Candidatus Sedimenticola endophacoides]OQX35438.1 MAG: NADH-quinone oxidoreductase subunit G [Candidatus Sedimenticola endophacoides]OQX40891.1 MAG: NADH-quinone oxidoreductase subunit G [Candidatus Sedimenticola endophacoides]OQX46293.1 MAG: NADH-quinone oxidoreductase subunit G [Candidatus Sedimenticola endophacoides]PUD99448.1 MAG: NADH-quinone oxidoreductase subunit G [Candidatus Sedimenticola endophacoides]